MKRSASLFLLPLLLASCAKSQPAATPTVATAPAGQAIHLEAEDGTLTGSTIQTKIPGFSGKGYVGDFQPDGAKVAWTIPNAKAGLYDVKLRYSAPSGPKGYDLAINGKVSSGMLAATKDEFATLNAGKIEMNAGANTVEMQRGWGYYALDAIDFTPAAPAPALVRPPTALVDAQASPAARTLLIYLLSQYGTKTLTGQYQAEDNETVQKETGKIPAVFGTDLMDYSPSRLARGTKPEGTVEAAIARAKAGQIVTVSWHWNAPSGLVDKMSTDSKGKPLDLMWYKGFNKEATTFDVQKALADPNSADYKLLLRDMDAIAAQLQKFQDAGVPVLWRPLHEAEGGWFWWGAKGPDSFKKLWRLMYDRYTTVDHLHNLVWVYSATVDQKPDWYPGDDVVDIVGADAYPKDTSDPLSGLWDKMLTAHGGKKMLALTEFGGVPDVDRMSRYGVRWSYFVTWNGNLSKTPDAVIDRVYKSELTGNAP